MFREEIDMAGNAAKKKIQFLRQQTGAYFISAMLAGMFVGFGVLLAFTAGGMLKEGGVPGVKFIMGGCFGVALSLVLMAGAELFTGSNFVMAVGMFQKKVTFQDSVTVWVTCWLGNLAGSVLVAGMYSDRTLYRKRTGDHGRYYSDEDVCRTAAAVYAGNTL